jgi:hypothetical protein
MPGFNAFGWPQFGQAYIPPILPVPADAINVWAAFGATGPFNIDTWYQIGPSVRRLEWNYGRQNELGQMETGYAKIVVADTNSAWDGDNTLSPYYPNVKLMLPIRGYLALNNIQYPLFYGYLIQKPRTLRVTNTYMEWELGITDGMELLARFGLAGLSFPQETSGNRIWRVLDWLGFPNDRRDISPGQVTLDAVSWPDDDSTKALTYVLHCADTEDGLFYWTPDGLFRFVDRSDLILDPQWSLIQATFRDGTLSGDYPYIALEPADDLQNVRNRWSGTRTGGVTQTAEDSASMAAYGTRDQQVQSLASTDGQVLAQIQHRLAKFALPLRRVDSIKIQPFVDLADAGRISAGLSRVVGERISVRELPPGLPAERSETYAIQHINGTLNSGPLVSGELDFQLWPADALAGGYWQAGDSQYSLAGVTTKASY